MNADVKAKWLEALRSGEYKQSVGTLRGRNGYCCLGVLCDLAVKEGITDWDYIERQSGSLQTEILLPPVTEWAGLTHAPADAEGTRLATHNDLGGSFDLIADLIEQGL